MKDKSTALHTDGYNGQLSKPRTQELLFAEIHFRNLALVSVQDRNTLGVQMIDFAGFGFSSPQHLCLSAVPSKEPEFDGSDDRGTFLNCWSHTSRLGLARAYSRALDTRQQACELYQEVITKAPKVSISLRTFNRLHSTLQKMTTSYHIPQFLISGS